MDSNNSSHKTDINKTDYKVKIEDGKEIPKLALEEFFQTYVDKWYREGKVNTKLYIMCRDEIHKLKGKVKNEEGKEIPKLALEEFFRKYVDYWCEEGKVPFMLYCRCCDEIDKFTGKDKKFKRRKAKPVSKESLDGAHAIESLPDLDKSNQKMDPEKRPHLQANKSSPVSVTQEQYESIIQTYQEALVRIDELEDEKAKLSIENGSILRQLKHLKGELKRSYAQMDNFKARYNKLASESLKNNDPTVSDLSDPYRPTEITRHFSELYDNEWPDAYEALTTTLKCSEEESLRILFDTVESSFEYMEDQRKQQVQLMRQVLLHPASFAQTKEDTSIKDLNKFIAKEDMEIQIKEIRKTHAPITATILATVFRDIELERRVLSPHEIITNSMPEALRQYAYQCALLSWHMVVADPPICMAKAVAGKPFDLERYRPYTKSIKGVDKMVVKVDVWPALYLHAGGPLLNKGVAQPGNALRK